MSTNNPRARARICPPCAGDCCQGKACPANPQHAPGSWVPVKQLEQRLPPGSGVALVIVVGFVVLAAAVAVLA